MYLIVIGIQSNNDRAWGQLGNNNNAPLPGPQRNSNSQTTTPWPALGQRRNQQPNTPQSPKPNNQPMWVRPENGPNWMRNPSTPSRNTGSNANTNFLNNERGGMPNMPNHRPNSNQPSQSQGGSSYAQVARPSTPNQTPNLNKPSQVGSNNAQAINPGQPVVVGGGKNPNTNTNNNMKGMVPTGSITNKPNTANQNTNAEPNNMKTTEDVEDYELREFSEELLVKDSNNAARFVTVNLQGMTTSRSTNDEAALP